jgi:hypothetical protein
MPFASGSVSFRRFAVVGNNHPEVIDQALLDKVAEHALKESEFGVPEEVEYGWSGGRHVLDGQFGFEHNVFGDALHIALRVDTNKVPGQLKKAYQLIEEEAVAATNPSGFISKSQKREVKDSVGRKIEEELKSGRFRRSKLVPMLWDVPSQTVYCSAGGATLEKLMEIFERTFDLKLFPLSAGTQALRLLEPTGQRRDYEDFRPTRFVQGPEGDSQFPEYPWVAKGPEPKDFLGNEFLLWLWHRAEVSDGSINVESLERDVTIMIDKSLELDCGYGMTGKDSLRGDGPSRFPEARDALRTGKLPRKAGMILDSSGQQFTFTFNPETFGCNGTQLPEVEEAETPRVLFEERITLLRDLCNAVDGLFEEFLKVRASSSWEGHTGTIRKWIAQNAKPVAATIAA